MYMQGTVMHSEGLLACPMFNLTDTVLFVCIYGSMVNMGNCSVKYSIKFLVTQNFRRNGIVPSLNITCFAFLYVTGAGSRV